MSVSSPLVRVFAAWERFLYEPVDARTLAFLRVVFGAYLVFYYVDLFPFLSLHHFPPALLPPRELAELGFSPMRLVNYGTLPRVAAYALTVAGAAALALGLRTRLAAAICWLGNRAFLQNIPGGTNSGDNVVAITCFLFLIAAFAGHAQKVYALDATRREPENRMVPAWSLRLFQVQLVIVYVFSGFHKVASQDWYLGQALFYVFHQRGWSRVNMTWIDDPIAIGLITYGTLFFELLIFPVLVWVKPLRPLVLGAGVLFHFGIASTMRVFVFGEIMPLLYLSFVNPARALAWCGARYRSLISRAQS